MKSTAFEQQVQEISKLISEDDICLLALCEAPESIKAHGTVHNALRTAIVNTRTLKPQDIDTAQGKEKYGRRVEKESMRAVGYLLGMEFCPLPMCALSDYQNDEQLDAKGRNFCPPCQGKMRKALTAAGVEVREQY
jgi:predicted Zn-dependent protease